ncbi:MAG: Ig domain-containing protein, partial [Oscillospiraceae bacterium]|nr:Ig domain-containing protein [Oscillospiraceae bacterium]
DENQLIVNCRDNQYVAVMSLKSLDGKTTYATAVPETFDDPGDLQVLTMDLTGVKAGETCLLMLGDYAGNESAYEVTLNLEEPGEGGGGGGTTPGGQGGSLYAFSQKNGSWISADVDSASYTTVNGNVLNVTAAEYVDGYAYMIGSDNGLYVAPHGNWNSLVKLTDLSAYGIEDMALNYVDQKLYALGADNTIYTVDLYTGTLTKAFTVSIINTKNAACTKLQGLGIDESGNFYAVCHGGDGYEFAIQAYKFDLEMVVDGAIVDLEPMKKVYSWGYTTYSSINGYSDNGQTLAWDFENDQMLYYSWGRYDIDTVGYLSESGGLNSVSSDLKLQMSAMYFEGSKIGAIELATEATALSVNTNELKMIPGATATIATTLTPWTLEDQSLTWTTSDETVATVVNGKVTAVSSGTATITVTTNASPNLQQVINVTVNELPETELFAFLMDVDGTELWVKFNSQTPEDWEIVSYGDGTAAIGGVLLKDVVYVHDGSGLYAMDPDLFTKEYVCGLGSYFAWTDAAGAEAVDGYFDRIVSPCNSGAGVAVIDPYTATVVEFDASGVLGNDALVTMALVSQSSVDGYPAYTFYSMAESGNLYEIVLTAIPAEEEDYDFSIRKLSASSVKLPGVSDLDSSYASSMYDATSGCLIVISYLENDSTARLYAIEPLGGASLELGTVGDAVWPAYSLYQYTEPADLTLRGRTESLSMYVGDEETISAYAVPTRFQGGVTFTSSDEAILTVDANGVVTAVAPGDAVVTVTTVDVNAAGETISKEIPVHVEDVMDVDLTIKAKLELTEDGSNWVTINTSDIKNPIITQYDHAYLYGGGVHDNVIYGGDNHAYIDWNYWAVVSNLYIIEPEYGYDITPGGIVSYQQAPSDLTTMPALELSYTDAEGNPATIIAGDMPIYVDQAEELIMWDVRGSDDIAAISGWNLAGEFDGTLGTLAFMGMTTVTEDGVELDAWSYAALTNAGNLYNIIIVPSVVLNDEGEYEVDYSASLNLVGNVGLTFEEATQMSLLYVNDGVNTGLVIAYYEDVAELYYVDISVEMLGVKLTGGKIGSIPGASEIAAMYLPEELQVEAAAPALVRGEIETMTTNVVAGPDRSAEYQYQLTDDKLSVGGSLNAVSGRAEQNSAAEGEGNTVTVTITEDVTVTNGLVEVTYDASKLSYVSTTSANLIAVNAKEGKLILAYASGTEILAGKAIAQLTFTVNGEHVETQVTIKTIQRNNEAAIEEADEIVEIVYEVGEHNYEVTDSKDATCTEDGYKTYTCTKCGDSYTDTITAPGHQMTET